jgi:hypothetical protein
VAVGLKDVSWCFPAAALGYSHSIIAGVQHGRCEAMAAGMKVATGQSSPLANP